MVIVQMHATQHCLPPTRPLAYSDNKASAACLCYTTHCTIPFSVHMQQQQACCWAYLAASSCSPWALAVTQCCAPDQHEPHTTSTSLQTWQVRACTLGEPGQPAQSVMLHHGKRNNHRTPGLPMHSSDTPYGAASQQTVLHSTGTSLSVY